MNINLFVRFPGHLLCPILSIPLPLSQEPVLSTSRKTEVESIVQSGWVSRVYRIWKVEDGVTVGVRLTGSFTTRYRLKGERRLQLIESRRRGNLNKEGRLTKAWGFFGSTPAGKGIGKGSSVVIVVSLREVSRERAEGKRESSLIRCIPPESSHFRPFRSALVFDERSRRSDMHSKRTSRDEEQDPAIFEKNELSSSNLACLSIMKQRQNRTEETNWIILG